MDSHLTIRIVIGRVDNQKSALIAWHASRTTTSTLARKSPTHQRGNPTPPGCRSGALGHDAPVVVGSRRYGFVSLDPIDNQLANLLTGSINHRCVFVHRVAAA